jgi:RNA polymerase sigma-70 factor (ECF subfamily)
VSTEPEKKLLAPLADAYEPTDADAERVFAKIQASLAALPAAPVPVARPPVPPAAGAFAGKNLALVGLCALAIVGGVFAWQSRREGPRPAAPASEVVAAPVVTAPAVPAPPVASAPVAATAAPAMLPSISVDSLPSASLAQPPGASGGKLAAAPAASQAPSSETLEKEARLLAEARRAVQRGEAAQGLALLDEHARTFPNGWLAADRAAERIVVLCSLGRRDEAVRESKAFLVGRPDGPLTRRVTASCAGE